MFFVDKTFSSRFTCSRPFAMISLRLSVIFLIFGVVFAATTHAPHETKPTHEPHATHAPHETKPTHEPHATHAPHETKPTHPPPSGGEVDAAIVNIDIHYNDELCLAILLVDCATHVTTGDEQVCGSNGVTYNNHCRFTHAVCETLHFKDHKITFQSHGACPATSAPLSTVAIINSERSAATHAPHETKPTHEPHATHAPHETKPTHEPHATHAPHETKPTHPPPSGGEVDAAIVNIDIHYTDELCLALLLVDCATHVTKGDEQVCGSNGVTYNNHCRFTHAVCETLHFKDHKITFQSHGACPATSAPLSTVAIVNTGTSGSVTNATTTSGPATATPMAPATTDAMGSIVQNVFCSNLATISCTGGFDVICGSDGQYYPNQCEISKAKCHDATLTIVTDTTKCQANVGGGK
ncbi:uncharacterized protein LOC127837375 isoform X2 [Dreissena polymorpha]|uniref:uncharacterized protein LOC127837375 isoform X2 n=1 Tax=Dreissena polymorpha TaxID=45954 RepID=UPI0022654D22|nr:uncharacterized protein LOC127837375 isoform X2 [Dreissena polymorpha]